MNTIIKLAAACTLALSLAACQSAPTKSLDEVNMALKSAEAANAAAKKLNVEWRDTGKIIDKARADKGKGKFDDAVKLAGKAERQALNAVKQFDEQKNAGPNF
jgi:starvation-inducible outer membrane lipoprotein